MPGRARPIACASRTLFSTAPLRAPPIRPPAGRQPTGIESLLQ